MLTAIHCLLLLYFTFTYFTSILFFSVYYHWNVIDMYFCWSQRSISSECEIVIQIVCQ